MRQQAVRTPRNEAGPLVRNVLGSPGRPLDSGARSFFEPRFGHDFSRVRVHTDERAAQSAASMAARAWTVGNDIAFGPGTYAPSSPHGGALLAHELSHVVQQSGAGRGASIGAGEAGDAYERDADTAASAIAAGDHAQPRLRASAPRLQGSFLGTLLDFTLLLPIGIYRLLGGEYYFKSTLEAYLKRLREEKSIEDAYDSDNKARACVKREGELGPYSADDRVLLIQEMLSGSTLDADEAAILVLLRGAKAGEAGQIVSRVGRDTLWSNFSGRNRRVLEALTMTAADAGDALVTRLRDLDPDEIQDYVTNAVDPDVRAAATRAAALRRFTAPVPVNAAIDAAGQATFQINGIDVVALPDLESRDEQLRTRAVTQVGIWMADVGQFFTDPQTNIVGRFNPPRIQARVQTIYGPGSRPGGPAGYGRGTTDEDSFAGQTSLRFHESRHGADWFEFLRTTAPPQFTGRVGMTGEQYQQAVTAFDDALAAYNCRATAFSIRRSDCVGKVPSEEHMALARSATCPIPATICKEQGGNP